ncbi:class IV adenylate cyclase [Treponema primitia]|uniref:class IV adenylate cyclase n=1 Tax=Treponema primitia TaxID=88058 RepID=UPI0039803013
MAIEIEVKAHVKDPQALKNRISLLAASAPFSFEKDDCYWITAGSVPGGIPKSGVRVRREKHWQDGAEKDEKILVTYKSKEIRDGIEINDEREFAVSSGDTFTELLKRLGLEPGIQKHKQGWSWIYGNVHAELCEVSGPDRNLGWFAELEILADDAGTETVAAARKQLLELLEKLSIPKDSIEERYYSELLSPLWTP